MISNTKIGFLDMGITQKRFGRSLHGNDLLVIFNGALGDHETGVVPNKISITPKTIPPSDAY